MAALICELEYDPQPIVTARRNLQLSVREAARRIGIHFVTLSGIENSRMAVTEETMRRICNFYEIPIDSVKKLV